MYGQQKSQNELLSMINACVSHELRNPLNSIVAQNVQKKELYEKLEKVAQDEGIPREVREALKNTVKDLNDGIKIQEASGSMMTCMI